MFSVSVLKSHITNCEEIKSDYYDLFTLKPFYPYPTIVPGDNYLRKIVNYWLANAFISFLYILVIPLVFVSGMLGNILAIIYMNFSLLFNLFYIPLTNTTEFLDLLKNHGDLITILFCIGIIGSSLFSKFDNTVTGIMSFLLVVIMFFKVSKSFQKKTPSI